MVAMTRCLFLDKNNYPAKNTSEISLGAKNTSEMLIAPKENTRLDYSDAD